MWATTSNILQGLGTSLRYHSVEQKESSLKISDHNFQMTAITQMILVDATVAMGKLFYEQYNGAERPLSGAASWLLYGVTWIPAVVAYEAAYIDKSTLKGRVIYWIYDHTSALSLIANCVSAIGLVAIGSYALGVSSLVGLTYGIACNHQIIPQSLRTFGDPAAQVIARISIVLFGSTLARVFVVVDLAMIVTKYAQKYWGKDVSELMGKLIDDPRYRRDLPTTPLTAPMILSLLESDDPLDLVEINYQHLNAISLPQPPENINYVDVILEKFDELIKKESEEILQKIADSLESDPRWKKQHTEKYPLKIDDKFNPELVPYLRDRLKGLLENIRDKKLQNGEIKNYKKYQDFLKAIAEKIQNVTNSNNENIENYLIRLGIDGGGYCPAGAVKAIEDGYNDFVFDPDMLPKEWLFYLLQKQRYRICERMCLAMTNMQPHIKFMKHLMGGDDDLHSHNVVMSMFDKIFGLNSPSIDEDNMVEKGATDEVLINLLISQGIGDVFHKGDELPQLYLNFDRSKKLQRRYNDFSNIYKNATKKKFRKWLGKNYKESSLIPNEKLATSAKDFVEEVINQQETKEKAIKKWLPNFVSSRHPTLISLLSWDISVENGDIYIDPYDKNNILEEIQIALAGRDNVIKLLFQEELQKIEGINETRDVIIPGVTIETKVNKYADKVIKNYDDEGNFIDEEIIKEGGDLISVKTVVTKFDDEIKNESYLKTIKRRMKHGIHSEKIKGQPRWKQAHLVMLMIQLGIFNFKKDSDKLKKTSWDEILDHEDMKTELE